ncbi:MAG: phosphoribosylglycinamide formyltransferase [Methylobacterium mesophilicum]|nr:phosphoribosylglycinamide formyltransferase [Methylobacterium mesophilicum]
MSTVKTPVAVLISGRGSNMAALIDAAAETDFPAEIVLVVSDNADAKGLVVAQQAGIATAAIERKDFGSKAEHEAAIMAALRDADAQLICLAGFMRVLSPAFIGAWRGRILNIHPSLLPSYRGLDPHKRALEDGVLIHGCSVHFVTEELDAGPIVAQGAVPVLADDTEKTLAARVLGVEHRIYPLALRMVSEGAAQFAEGRVRFRHHPEPKAGSASLITPAVSSRSSFEDLARLTP